MYCQARRAATQLIVHIGQQITKAARIVSTLRGSNSAWRKLLPLDFSVVHSGQGSEAFPTLIMLNDYR